MTDNQALWDAYNLLCGGPDRERLRKLLVRYDLFRMAAPLPGDVVECGVFKGTGLMTWLKLLAIYQPGTEKRVVGFDVFSEFPEPAEEVDKDVVSRLVRESDFRGLKPGTLYGMVEAAGIPKSACDLVEGDIRITAREYVAKHIAGFVSHSCISIWHRHQRRAGSAVARVVRGGIVVFDEYAIPRWSEREGVDHSWRRTT